MSGRPGYDFGGRHPLDWLPKPGECKPVPGGHIVCEQWTVEERGGLHDIEGEIRFRFSVNPRFLTPIDEPKALPASTMELTNGPLALEDGK